MNYRNAALAELQTLAYETENYKEGETNTNLTVGQLLLAIIKRKPEGENLNEWLMNVTDEDMYSKIEQTKLKERP